MIEYPMGDYTKGKALVLLYGGYHSNCNITLNMLNDIEKRYYKIKFIKINTSKYYKIKEKYQIHVLPSLLYFEDGNLIDHISGSFNYRQIEKLILRS